MTRNPLTLFAVALLLSSPALAENTVWHLAGDLLQDGATYDDMSLMQITLYDGPADSSPTVLWQSGYTEVAGTRKSRPARLDRWWWVAMAALGVVLFEWYIYNRRVYL